MIPETGISGLEQTAPPVLLEFFFRSIQKNIGKSLLFFQLDLEKVLEMLNNAQKCSVKLRGAQQCSEMLKNAQKYSRKTLTTIALNSSKAYAVKPQWCHPEIVPKIFGLNYPKQCRFILKQCPLPHGLKHNLNK